MTITHRTKLNEINSNQELIDYINTQIIKEGNRILQIKHGYESIIYDWVSSDITIKHSHVFSSYKELIECTSNRVFQKDFWIDRGYSIEDSEKIVSKHQSDRTKKGWNSGKFKDRLLPSNIEYWTTRGYSHEAAVSKVSESQTTFTLEKCIEKYGKEEGVKVYNERQVKWQSNMDYSTFDTKVTWELYLNKYESLDIAFKEWLILANNKRREGHEPNKMVQELLKSNFLSIRDVYKFLIDSKNPFEIVKSGAILSVINMSKNEFIEQYFKTHNITSKNSITKVAGIFGNRYYYSGHYFESNLELEVGMKLMDMDLEFICHKQYPNSSRKYDFYIPSLEVYIEAMGMPNESYTNKRKELSGLNIIWSDNVNEIVNNLSKIIA